VRVASVRKTTLGSRHERDRLRSDVESFVVRASWFVLCVFGFYNLVLSSLSSAYLSWKVVGLPNTSLLASDIAEARKEPRRLAAMRDTHASHTAPRSFCERIRVTTRSGSA